MPIASLPMYDWPEVESETDHFWDRLRGHLEGAGIPAPERLTRRADPEAEWLADDLVLSQSCGYPFSTVLKDRVTLVGTPAYAIDAPAGSYFSVLIGRAEDRTIAISDLAARRFAYNARNSQSGFRAPVRWLASNGVEMAGATIETHSHRRSIRAVAEGRADFASIDAVSWQLALRHEPSAGALAILGRTPVTPGLPFISAHANAKLRQRIAVAVGAAIAGLEEDVRNALLVTGFVRTEPVDYATLADDLSPAEAG